MQRRGMYRRLIFHIALFSAVVSSAQVASFNALKQSYNWKPTPKLDASIPPLDSLEGADILYEKQRVTFLRSKPELLSIVHERHVVFRFGTREAIEKFTRFRLPESFDPNTDFQDVAIEDRDSIPRPLYFEVALEQFAARVIGPAERQHELEPEKKLFRQRKKTGDRWLWAHTFDLELNGVAPGDTVEVRYKYVVPFRDNWFQFNSKKHFFHSNIRRHDYQLQIDATRNQGLRLHGAPPDSSSTTKRKRYAFWRLKNLPPCLDEVNARPAWDLPYVSYGTAADSDLYQHGHVVNADLNMIPYMYSNIPYWVTILRIREAEALKFRRLGRKQYAIGQQKKLRDVLAELGGVELTPLAKALMVHNKIAGEFRFQWDDAWFDNEDLGLLKHGDMMEEKTLREIGRYSQYSKVLNELKLKYYAVYLQDKRAGVFNENELTNLFENEFMFMLRSDQKRFFLYPKRSQGGYFVDEKPFYWEGVPALVSDLDKLWDNEKKKVQLAPMSRMKASSNVRLTSVSVDLTEPGALKANAQIKLNGQFSTMTRHAYMFNESDSTCSPDYGKRYLEQWSNFKSEITQGPWQRPPFSVELNVEASKAEGLEQINDSLYHLRLEGLFPFILPEGFKAEGRDLAFYWDFPHHDRFKVEILLPFDARVETKQEQYGSKELGTQLFYEVRQVDARKVALNGALRVSKEKVTVALAAELEELLREAIGVADLELELVRMGNR